MEGPNRYDTHSGYAPYKGTLGTGSSFSASNKQACFLSQKETLTHFSRLLATNTTSKTGSSKERSVQCILGILGETRRNAKHMGEPLNRIYFVYSQIPGT